MIEKNVGGRPRKFNRVEVAKVRVLVSRMSKNGEKITWDSICKNVNLEICPMSPTTKKTLLGIDEVRQAYEKAKATSRGNALHSKTYAKYTRDKLLGVISKLEADLEQARAELLQEKERKIIEFETFLSRPKKRNPKFFSDLRHDLGDTPF